MPEHQIDSLAPQTEEKSVRFHFIDGMRGIAAVSVLLYHIWFNAELRRPLAAWCPAWTDGVFFSLSHGVDIFFVLSGFVIAYSIRKMRISRDTATNFILRRQLRLDPPYWLWTVVTLPLIAIAAHKNPGVVSFPSVGAFFANLFYVQGIMGLPYIVRPSWTLCLEVQFYLVFIGIVWLIQRFRREQVAALLILLPLAAVSLFWSVRYSSTPWFIGTWYLFATGVLAYWAFVGRMHAGWLIAFVTAILWLHFRVTPTISVVGACTGLFLFGVGRLNHLHDWLDVPLFRYFGAISYSLYLVHFDLVSLVARAEMRLTGDSPFGAILWFLMDIGLSVLVAHILHRCVEKPAIRFAARFKPLPQHEQREYAPSTG